MFPHRKQGKKGTPAKFTEGLNEMCKDIKIRVKWGGNYILEEFHSNVGLRHGCTQSPTLFNIFVVEEYYLLEYNAM
jgi:hypothetical protein